MRKALLIATALIVPGGLLIVGGILLRDYLKNRKSGVMKISLPIDCVDCRRIVAARGTVTFVNHLIDYHGMKPQHAENIFQFVYGGSK